jgi:hypothetical protein
LFYARTTNHARQRRKKLRSRGGFEAGSPLSHMNRQNMNTPVKTKYKSNHRKKEPMQTKQSVTNSNNQPSTACTEKHAAMKLPIASTVIAAFGFLSLLAVSETTHAQGNPPTPVVFQAAGADVASIQCSVDAFRAALGDPNNLNNPGPLQKGRREINWDGGNPNVLDTTAPVNPFLVFLNTRGSQFKTPGLGLSQAPPSGGPQGGLAVLFGNPTYGQIFRTFSASRLFTAVGSNITEASFAIPGTNGLVTAAVRGFGAVFTDVDQSEGSGPGLRRGNRNASAVIEYFGRDGRVLFTGFIPSSAGNGNLSFFGIVFDDARIASVRIKSGNVAPGPNDDEHHDIIMMDDFIYGEPQLLQ